MGPDSTDTQTTPTDETAALPASSDDAPAQDDRRSRRRTKQEPAPIAHTPEDVAALAPSLEAALLSTDKPVQPTRLAIALGLITLDPETGEDAKTATDGDDRGAEVQTKKPSAASLTAARPFVSPAPRRMNAHV